MIASSKGGRGERERDRERGREIGVPCHQFDQQDDVRDVCMIAGVLLPGHAVEVVRVGECL